MLSVPESVPKLYARFLSQIDLEAERTAIREELKDNASEAKRKKLVKRLKIIDLSSNPIPSRNG